MKIQCFILFILCLKMDGFAQYEQKIPPYTYYEDSLLGYPSPFKFITAQKKPEPINLYDDFYNILKIPKELTEAGDYTPSPTFKILIDEEGCYVKHILLKSANRLFIKEMERCLPFIRYTPAMQNGKPIKFWLVMNFHFHLR